MILNLLLIPGLGLALLLSTKTFQMPHPAYHEDASRFLYHEGNASEEVRAEILDQLMTVWSGFP